MQEECQPGMAGMPNHLLLKRNGNRQRKKDRPTDPTTPEFELDMNHVPDGFLRSDEIVDGSRHLVFFTDAMADLLVNAKTWFVDATFKVVANRGNPFQQLFSVHAFIRKGASCVQVPLAFALMTTRRAVDYQHVLQVIKDRLPAPPDLTTVVLDFEHGMWIGVRRVFGDAVRLQGCHFHWNQCIWRKIQEIGLSVPYKTDDATRKFCRKLMALPFLPAQHIQPVFTRIRDAVTAQDVDQRFTDLTEYVHLTWINSNVWPPENWTVFGLAIRTNNDLEGYHRGLNHRANGNGLGLYKLLYLLEQEAKHVDLQTALVTDEQMARYQRTKYQRLQNKIFQHWDDFNDGRMTTLELLKKVSAFNGPSEE